MEQEIQAQRKVAGFDKAIATYRKIVRDANQAVVSKRKEEFAAYVKRVVFNDGNDTVIHYPDLHTQQQIVERMKDIN